MLVNHSFNLLGMNLKPADVDDPAAAPDEVIAPIAQLKHVTRVDVTVRADERGILSAQVAPRRSRRADPQRAVLDFHVDAVAGLPKVAGRNACEAILDFEPHASLGGRKGVGDFSFWVDSPQSVKYALIGDLTGQTNVLRRDPSGSAAHERTAPMRRRAGDVGNPMRRRTGQKVARGFFGT